MMASARSGPGVTRVHRETFRRGSTTYYNSSVFFPPAVRTDVFALYGFVRVADDYVDRVPQDAAGFRDFRRRYLLAREGQGAGVVSADPIIDSFVELSRRHRFPEEWIDAFFRSMEMDITHPVYETLEETLEYIHGSAEVIGLFMATLLGLGRSTHRHAMMLGRAMQYINFIRDIDEDRRLGRSYLPWDGPAVELTDSGYARAHASEFRRYLAHHLDLYQGWQREAAPGLRSLPRRYRIPIQTASDMYAWTARTIRADPFVVFRRKVKPTRSRIVTRVLRIALGIPGPRS